MWKVFDIITLLFFVHVASSFPQRQTNGDGPAARKIVSVGPLLSQIFEDLKEMRGTVGQGPLLRHRPPLPLPFLPFAPRLPSDRIDSKDEEQDTKNVKKPMETSNISNEKPKSSQKLNEDIRKPLQKEEVASKDKQKESTQNDEPDVAITENEELIDNKQEKIRNRHQHNRRPGSHKRTKKPNRKTQLEEPVEEPPQKLGIFSSKEPNIESRISGPPTEIQDPMPANTPKKQQVTPSEPNVDEAISKSSDGKEKVEDLTRKIIGAPCIGGFTRSGDCRESFD